MINRLYDTSWIYLRDTLAVAAAACLLLLASAAAMVQPWIVVACVACAGAAGLAVWLLARIDLLVPMASLVVPSLHSEVGPYRSVFALTERFELLAQSVHELTQQHEEALSRIRADEARLNELRSRVDQLERRLRTMQTPTATETLPRSARAIQTDVPTAARVHPKTVDPIDALKASIETALRQVIKPRTEEFATDESSNDLGRIRRELLTMRRMVLDKRLVDDAQIRLMQARVKALRVELKGVLAKWSLQGPGTGKEFR